MTRYADIIIDISARQLDRPFTYRIPEGLKGHLQLGMVVEIPFGSGDHVRTGYVVAFRDKINYPEEKVKTIIGLSGKQAISAGSGEPEAAEDPAIRLASWMSRTYGSTMITALRTVLTARKKAAPVEKRSIELLLSGDEASQKLLYYTTKHQVARARLLKELMSASPLPYELVTGKLHVGAPTIRSMKEQGVLAVTSTVSLRNPVKLGEVDSDHKTLSPAQKSIVDGVLKDYDSQDPAGRVSLLHGITGSGKTEVYIAVIEGMVRRGRQAIMLIPEIALTYQTLLRFYRHFGDRVSVMNSSLSEGEKSDQMERARRGEIDVIIGPRSALFTPFPKLGIIVIDEEHENSYKNESMPKYHARETAEEIARERGAVLLLGSATPSMEAYFRAKKGEYRLYELSERLTGGELASVQVADMRRELQAGNRSILSAVLRKKLEERLASHEQVMLFLNRRGFSGFVSCRSCGHVLKCPHCEVSLSQHRDGRLVCHYCGYEQPAVKICPDCGSKYLSGFRAGTEQIEEVLKKEYPGARILRMDADTTRRKGDYERILSSFANEEADILIGTQMIVKGHDFPRVTLVGILLADLSLYAEDYRAAERTFQLLTQAAGRAGRGLVPGEVIIQTYQPDHYSIRHAAHQDYKGFYEEEILYRSLLRYPPAAHLLAVQIMSENEDEALQAAGRVREAVQRYLDEEEDALIIGPAAALLPRLRDQYRFAVYIKAAKYDTLVGCKDVIEQWKHTLDETGRGQDVLLQFDFDPVNPY